MEILITLLIVIKLEIWNRDAESSMETRVLSLKLVKVFRTAEWYSLPYSYP